MSPSSAFTSPAFVQSPQRTRCRPHSHASPGRVTGLTGARGLVRVGEPAVARRPGHDLLDLAGRESGQSQIEVQLIQREQLVPEQANVPAGVQSNLVVGDDGRPALGRR